KRVSIAWLFELKGFHPGHGWNTDQTLIPGSSCGIRRLRAPHDFAIGHLRPSELSASRFVLVPLMAKRRCPFHFVCVCCGSMIVTPRQLTNRAEFYHQLQSLTSAGIGIVRALEQLQRAPPSMSYREPIQRVLGQLARGYTLGESLKTSGNWLP